MLPVWLRPAAWVVTCYLWVLRCWRGPLRLPEVPVVLIGPVLKLWVLLPRADMTCF
jgi:hypothetical protein